MSKKTQRTLGFYGFTKSREHRGKKIKIEISNTVEPLPPVVCAIC